MPPTSFGSAQPSFCERWRLPYFGGRDIIAGQSLAGAVSSVVRAPRSHRGGRRFKSSIAHHPAAANGFFTSENHRPRWRNGRRAAFRAQCPLGRVGSNPSLGTIFPTRACSSVDRALPCGGRGREFESRQARHLFAPSNVLGRLAQMVRASALHAEGRGFESLTAHQPILAQGFNSTYGVDPLAPGHMVHAEPHVICPVATGAHNSHHHGDR